MSDVAVRELHAAPPPPSGPVPFPRGLSIRLLTDMLRIRRLEEKCAELYAAGKIRGFLHLYIGEEAVAAGAMPALAPEDNVVATYREHGHAFSTVRPAFTAATPSSAAGCRSPSDSALRLR